MSRRLLVASMVILALAFAGQAKEWSLPGINGHAPDVWVGDRNWTKDLGNPMTDQGASWGLYYQIEAGGDFKPMVYGLAYNYTFVWRSSEANKLDEGHGDDPDCMYAEMKLNCTGGKTFPGDGPGALVTFKAGSAGKFKLEAEGTASVQAPTAGNARLKVLVLDSALKTVKEVKVIDLKSKDNASISETIELKGGESIGVAIQSINPGPAGCGKSSISFTKFKVAGE